MGFSWRSVWLSYAGATEGKDLARRILPQITEVVVVLMVAVVAVVVVVMVVLVEVQVDVVVVVVVVVVVFLLQCFTCHYP